MIVNASEYVCQEQATLELCDLVFDFNMVASFHHGHSPHGNCHQGH